MAGETEMERVWRLARHLPGVEQSRWYGTPGLKVGGKGFARLREPGVLMLLCPIELKEALIEAEPDICFETAHYRGWPGMLVRLGAIGDDRLRDRIECAWRERAPGKRVKQQEEERRC